MLVQGELEITAEAGTRTGQAAPRTGERAPFLMLALDLPPAPLYKDALEKQHHPAGAPQTLPTCAGPWSLLPRRQAVTVDAAGAQYQVPRVRHLQSTCALIAGPDLPLAQRFTCLDRFGQALRACAELQLLAI